MKYAGAAFFLLMLVASGAAAAIPTVKFTPSLKIYECPPVFKQKSECVVTEKKLEQVKIWLSIDIASQSMGQWTYQETSPVPVSFFVIVLQGQAGARYEYSVSAETGVTGSGMPFSNSRAEFDDATVPRSLGVSSTPFEKDGKKYITELKLSDFHGRPFPTKK